MDEGDAGGVAVVAHKQRRAYQGLVVAVNGTKRVKVGDLISWDQGRGEEVTTLLGEKFFHLTESNAAAVDDEFGKPKEPTLLPSGLWIA
jgi:co-chaperonin GroES (HSP10)